MSASASTNPTSPSVTSISCDRCAPTRGTAVVAGATGYLGRHVVKAFHARGFRVRAVVRDPKRLGSALPFCHEVVVGQVTELKTLPGIFDDTDIAFSSIGVRHFRRRPTFREVDYRANAALATAAEGAGVRRYFFVSVHQGSELRRCSELVEARERVVDVLRQSPMETVVLRPTGCFNDLSEVFCMASAGRVWLIGDGTTSLNPVHGADVAAAAADAVDRGPRFRELSIGGPEIFTQREIADLAFRVIGRRPRYGRVSGRTLAGAARLLRPFNRNAASIMLMFAALAGRDAVAPCLGMHRLADHFAELALLRKAS
jgi:uncharacterized protein YbjT (DUF2867 family)